MSLVSLVLATYGRSDDVRRMLDSLTMQTDTNFELLIVDQNPDERLQKHIAYGQASGLNIRHLRLAPPSLSGARNFGIALARGEIVGLPDDDCWYEPETVARVRHAFAQESSIDGLAGNWVEQVEASGSASPTGRLSYAEWRQFQGKNASSITLFFRRQLFECLGGFDERLGVGKWYGAAEETDFILRALASNARLDYCPMVKVHHVFTLNSRASLLASCRAMRRRGRGTGAIYAKHRMSCFVILRGILGQVIRPFLEGKLRDVVIGASVSLGLLEGFLKWQCWER